MKRYYKVLIAGIVLIAGTGVYLFGKQGVFYPWSDLRRKNEEIVKKSMLIDSLRREIELLKNDTGYIERVAREKLGMAKPGERVYKFIEKE